MLTIEQYNYSINDSEGPMISNKSDREFGFREVSPALCARDYKDPKLVKEPSIKIAIKDKFQKTAYDPNGISPTVREGHGDGRKCAPDG